MDVTKLAVTVEAKAFVDKAVDLSGASSQFELAINLAATLLDGTGATQVNQIYTKADTITGSARNTYDLAGSLEDAYGDTITFTRVKLIVVHDTSTLAARLRIGGGSDGAGTNAFDTWVTGNTPDGAEGPIVRQGGLFALYTPDATAYAVTATTADILAIEELDGNNGSYNLLIAGTV